MSDTTVKLLDRGARVTIRGGGAQRVTLRRDTVAKINDARQRTVVQPRETPVEVTSRPTVVRTGSAMGMQGPAGAGDKFYRHQQSIPSASWVIAHNLNKYPAVTVVDSGGEMVEGDVAYDSPNQVTLTFSGAFSGEAYFN